MTLTERARSGLDHFVAQAARGSLANADNGLELLTVDNADATESRVVMLTVSSYTFRVLLFIHFDDAQAAREYFGALAGKQADELAGERFYDAVMERGNLLCGAVNRDLAEFFPHIGMSTPCVLQRSAVEQLAAVNPTFTRCYRARTDANVPLHITMAVCASTDFDFPFDTRAAVQTEAAGELEMF